MASTGTLNGSDPQRRDSPICFNPICSDKADSGHTKVTMTMDFVPKFGIAGKVMIGALKPKIRGLLQSMLKGNADYIEHGKVANPEMA